VLSFEKKIHQHFIQKGWTLSLAESCTGGAVSALLVQEAGASLFFLGSLVSYSVESKQKILGVKAEEIVSEICAKEMALGVKKLFGSTHAAAVTGDAGPTGSAVGKICFAVATENSLFSQSCHFQGERNKVLALATKELLTFLWNHVSTH